MVYVQRSIEALAAEGFAPENTLAGVAVCRDELTRPFVAMVREVWGEAFELGSLGGLVFAGKAGIAAMLAHTPVRRRRRAVFFGLSHVGIDVDGEVGRVHRDGHPEASYACGALVGLLGRLERGELRTGLDPANIEFSLLRDRVLPRLRHPAHTDLLELTEVARGLIAAELDIRVREDAIEVDWALFSGVLIHGPEGDWVAPGSAWLEVGGARRAL
ncbi:MAG: hypothetical protein JXX28_07760 [Deltaproteobacteria bacterium]|nr:hypothetical protein [Deltaproteobacteria bacterium]